MADLRLFANTSNIVRFVLKHSTTGQGLTGLTSASSGLIISTIADNEATATAYTQAGSTIETITTLGTFATPTATKCRFKEVDSANHKGLYEFQFADARFAVASSRRMVISVTGAASLLDTDYEIQLVRFDPYDAVRLGLAALPNVAAAGNGGLPTVDASNAVKVQSGTGAGQVSLSSGTVTLTDSSLTSAKFGAGAITATVIATDAIDNDAIAANAVTEIQSGLATAASIAALNNISAVDVWAAGTRTLTSFGTLVADIWAAVTRTLTAGTNIVLAKGTGVTGFNDLSLAQVNAEVDTALADYDAPTNAELVTEINSVQTDIASLNNLSAAQINAEVVDVLRTDTIPDSYAADGVQPTIAQAMLAIHQFLTEKSVTGTTVSVMKPDGVSTVMTFTLNNGTTPTSITRSA